MNEKQTWKPIERALKRAVPPLRAPDTARAEAVCRRLPPLRPESATGGERPLFSRRTLIRAAACLILALGVTVLLRSPSQPPGSVQFPDISPANVAAWASTVVNAPILETALTTEADNLSDDLTDLTYVVNQHAFSLFP